MPQPQSRPNGSESVETFRSHGPRGIFFDADGSPQAIFADGFESGDTAAWTSEVP